jgi:hypothetical protein
LLQVAKRLAGRPDLPAETINVPPLMGHDRRRVIDEMLEM